MKRYVFPLVALAALAVAACVVAVNTDDRPPGSSPVWTQRATMRQGERALFDGGALEITLQDADDDEATILVRDARGQSSVRLRDTGHSRGVQWPPYRIWLESADDDRATISVSRER